ncbi:hypothetical protein [Nocardioides sp. P5_E3]
MALEINQHVARLRRFQPFQTDSAELVYEHTDPNEPHFETATLQFLADLIEQSTVRLVVLTGDAGHGKTSLCARLLERLGHEPQQALTMIRELGTATEPIATTRSGRELRLLTDLSELSPKDAGKLLADLVYPADNAVAIVCANEGHLRSSVGADPTGNSRVVIDTLESGITRGVVAGPDLGVQVINMNFQSTAPDGRDGLIDWATSAWVDGRRWRSCQKCDAQAICPIFDNFRSLGDSEKGAPRRRGIRALFATAERMGAVITTRQALAVVAFALTGGLVCEDVHRRYSRDRAGTGWQYQYLYHQAIFADRILPAKRRQVSAFEALRKLDPGMVSLRQVDDVLDPDLVKSRFSPPALSSERAARSRREAQRDSEVMRALMTFLRRVDYFDVDTARLRRMGLAAGTEFTDVAEGTRVPVEVRDKLLRGLEAVQGVRRLGEPPDFLVLDPAFFSHRNRAAVIATRVQGRNVEVMSQVDHWEQVNVEPPTLPAAVDWSSREIYVRVAGSTGVVTIPLDLMRFELLQRWAAGLTTRGQYEAEMRSLTRILAGLARGESPDEDIEVLVNGERRSLMIDVGERIRSGGA